MITQSIIFTCQHKNFEAKLHYNERTQYAHLYGQTHHANAGALVNVTIGGMTLTDGQWWLLDFCEYLAEFCARVFVNKEDWRLVIDDIDRKQPRLPLDQR